MTHYYKTYKNNMYKEKQITKILNGLCESLKHENMSLNDSIYFRAKITDIIRQLERVKTLSEVPYRPEIITWKDIFDGTKGNWGLLDSAAKAAVKAGYRFINWNDVILDLADNDARVCLATEVKASI